MPYQEIEIETIYKPGPMRLMCMNNTMADS